MTREAQNGMSSADLRKRVIGAVITDVAASHNLATETFFTGGVEEALVSDPPAKVGSTWTITPTKDFTDMKSWVRLGPPL